MAPLVICKSYYCHDDISPLGVHVQDTEQRNLGNWNMTRQK